MTNVKIITLLFESPGKSDMMQYELFHSSYHEDIFVGLGWVISFMWRKAQSPITKAS